MANITDADRRAHEDRWERIFAADPEMQRLLATNRANVGGKNVVSTTKARAVAERAKALGYVPLDQDETLGSTTKNGVLVLRPGKSDFLTRNMDWIVPLALTAGIVGPGLVGAGAAPGSGTAAAALGSTVAGSAAGAGTAAGAGSAVASGTTPALMTAGHTLPALPGATSIAGPKAVSWAAKLFGDGVGSDLIKAGVGSGLGYLQRRSERNADREAIDAALAEQKAATAEANARLDRQGRLRHEILNTQRGDFNNLAMPGFSTLSELLGLGRPQPIGPLTFQNAPPPTGSGAMSGVPRGTVPLPGEGGSNFNPRVGQLGVGMTRTLSDFSGGSSIGMVQMRSPDGAEVEWVPPDQVQHFESKGAVRI